MGEQASQRLNQYVAHDMASFLAAVAEVSRGFDNTKPWWRGQANADWRLVPSLYRGGLAKSESNLNQRFRMMAPARYAGCPGNDDPFAWLFLMQHYGLPTRLLDWSESPLVALHFALDTTAPSAADAALWGLSATGLNLHQMHKQAICVPGNADSRPLGVEAFGPRTDSPDCRILSVVGQHSDLRHLVQQCAFTIHGAETPIDNLPDHDEYLAMIRIPAAARPLFSAWLDLLGISSGVLFPDLEHLAAELRSMEFALPAEQALPAGGGKLVQ